MDRRPSRQGAQDGADFRLELHGRYSHSREYVLGVLAEAGLSAHIRQADLRMEAGEPVPGLVVLAAKIPRGDYG